MKNRTFVTLFISILFILFFSASCENKMMEHYEIPDWLKGSAWNVLEERGEYTIFLKGVELAGYKPILKGKGLLTVMAPDDLAFSNYLQDKGYSEIEDIDKDKLKKLIGFHLLYYSYNKDKMVNFRPEGDLATAEDREKNAGLYYKYRTRSNSGVTSEVDLLTGKRFSVYHLDRFLPVFSYRFFNSKDIDAKSNYEYFYPESTWSGNDGFNVSNASVDEYEIIADNGYIFSIDQVLEPLETLYTELEKNDAYTYFFDLYNRNSVYEYDNTLTTDYSAALGADSLFLHKHKDLPSIAVEWYSSDYTNIGENAKFGYTIFAPSNDALFKFFKEFWEIGGYEFIEDVDELVISHLLHQFIYSGSSLFPSEIESGLIKNKYGMPFSFNTSTISHRAMCVNGAFYGVDVDNFKMPPLFGSVVGPAFRNKNNNYYLYMLSGSGLLASYASQDAKYTLLIPENNQLISSGIELKSYTTGSFLQKDSEEGWVNLSASEMQTVVNMHTVTGGFELKKTGTQVGVTQTGFNYWYVKDGKITSSSLFNQLLEPTYVDDPFFEFTEITNNEQGWNNGRAYLYDSSELFEAEADNSDGLQHALAVSNDHRYLYYAFAQLMKKAGMINTSTNSIRDFVTAKRFISFIPTNDAVKDALSRNEIPGIAEARFNEDGTLSISDDDLDVKALRTYLLSFFITDNDNVITTYPFPGSAMKTNTYISANKKQLKYTDSGDHMTVQLEDGKIVSVINDYDFFPFSFKDGCIQLIDELF